jgi:hypothetical protein
MESNETPKTGRGDMSRNQYSSAEVVRRGEDLYERRIRGLVEPGEDGKFLVLDIDTGEYAIDADEVTALKLMMDKIPHVSPLWQ